MGGNKICKIDGEAINNYDELLAALKEEVGLKKEGSYELEGILNASGNLDIVWQNSEASQDRMGLIFEEAVHEIRKHGPGGSKPKDNVHLFLN